jgi:hypothetical protein
MNLEWVLLIGLLTAKGDFIDKIPVAMPNEQACVYAKENLPKKGESPRGMRFQALCVTMDHWTGKKIMKDVPLD